MAEAKRRLAAILAADVAGYSRLMGDDEQATLDTLNSCRDVFRDRVSDRHGRVVDTAGDSVLAVFDSVVEAVACATTVQAEIAGRNSDLAEARRMRFRIGINLGDVIEQVDGTLYGDGVNVAARMETLAEPGGICVSGKVFDEVEGKSDHGFEDIGEHEVKNIARPVRAYRIGTNADHASSPQPLPLPDKPSIAVLPFDNLSGDKEQEYFADGIAEDLITALSRIRWLFVTARNSTFTYKGHSADVRRIGEELGVHYVVEGSVRKGGERIRITAQLVDAASGNHIWAERYDRNLADIFVLQDEIVETLVAALQTELGEFERERAHRKPPENLDAWESYQRGLWHLWQLDETGLAEARRLFQLAAKLDPGFAQPLAACAYALVVEVSHRLIDDVAENLDQAFALANRAAGLDNKEPMSYFSLGRVLTLRGDCDGAIEEFQTAIELNPNLAVAHFGLGHALFMAGHLQEAIHCLGHAIRLSPSDPLVCGFYHVRAWTYLLLGNYEEAAHDARRSIRRYPSPNLAVHTVLASALGHLDRREEAKIALDKVFEIKPDFIPEDVLLTSSPFNPEALLPTFKEWFDGLRKAGLDTPNTSEPIK